MEYALSPLGQPAGIVGRVVVGRDRDLLAVLGIGFGLLAVMIAIITALRAWDYRWSIASVPTSLAVYWGEELGRRVGNEARKAGMTDAMFAELMAVVGRANETNRLAGGYQVEIDAQFRS